MSQRRITDVQTGLKVLSQVRPHQRLVVSEGISVDTREWFVGTQRWLEGQSRAKTVTFLELLLDDAYALLKTWMQQLTAKSDTQTVDGIILRDNAKRLGRLMASAGEGRENLKLTYAADVSITSKLDIMRERLDSELGVFRQLLPDLVDRTPEDMVIKKQK